VLRTANIVPSSQITVNLMMEAILSSESSVVTGATSDKTSFFIFRSVKPHILHVRELAKFLPWVLLQKQARKARRK
jgi:hypothetical protein